MRRPGGRVSLWRARLSTIVELNSLLRSLPTRFSASSTNLSASADARATAERDLSLKLLVAGEREGSINAVFRSLGYVPPASSALAHYRERWRASIEQARASRMERALTEGLALRAERVAKLKEHAAILDEMRFVPDKNGRLWNERAWRQTLADIAEEMGERRPKESEQSGEVVKVVIGIAPHRV